MTDRPEAVKNLRGRVTVGLYAKGSKSERRAVFLETERGRFVLRRRGGPTFADHSLDRFVGHEVDCDGFLVGKTLLADRVDELE